MPSIPPRFSQSISFPHIFLKSSKNCPKLMGQLSLNAERSVFSAISLRTSRFGSRWYCLSTLLIRKFFARASDRIHIPPAGRSHFLRRKQLEGIRILKKLLHGGQRGIIPKIHQLQNRCARLQPGQILPFPIFADEAFFLGLPIRKQRLRFVLSFILNLFFPKLHPVFGGIHLDLQFPLHGTFRNIARQLQRAAKNQP